MREEEKTMNAEALREKRESLEIEIEERRAVNAEFIAIRNALRTRRKELEHEMGEVEFKTQQNERDSNENGRLIRNAELQLSDITKDLRDAELAEKVEQLFEKQPGFWEELEKVYSSQVSETEDGLSDFGSSIDSKKFCEKIRSIHQRQGFDVVGTKIRGAISGYENVVRELCAQKIRGRAVSTADKQLRLTPIQRFIFDKDVEPLWNVQ